MVRSRQRWPVPFTAIFLLVSVLVGVFSALGFVSVPTVAEGRLDEAAFILPLVVVLGALLALALGLPVALASLGMLALTRGLRPLTAALVVGALGGAISFAAVKLTLDALLLADATWPAVTAAVAAFAALLAMTLGFRRRLAAESAALEVHDL